MAVVYCALDPAMASGLPTAVAPANANGQTEFNMNRREFVRTAAALPLVPAVRAAKLAPVADGMRVGHRLSPSFDDADLAFFRNLGIEYATIWTDSSLCNYEYFVSARRRLERAGIRLLNIGNLDLHCDPDMVLGLAGRDHKIEQYKQYLRDLGRAGIHYTTYAHMANIKLGPYYATGRGTTRGVPTRLFDLEQARNLPLSHARIYHEAEIWDSFTHFIRAVIPVAEEAGVRIGLHPDDPPVPSLGGVARIFVSAAGYQRAIDLAASENFGLCLCVGSWAEGGNQLDRNVYEMVETFGPKGRIFKVHFRNVDAPLPRFQESIVDAGYIDMDKVARRLNKAGVNAVAIPDHVPGEGLIGNITAYTIGYMRSAFRRAQSSAS